MADITFIGNLEEAVWQLATKAMSAYRAVDALKTAVEPAGWATGESKLLHLSARYSGSPTWHRRTKLVLANLADEMAADIAHVRPDGGKTLAAFAEKPDIASWKAAAVLPRGAHYEAVSALALMKSGVAAANDDASVTKSTTQALEQQLIRCNLALAYQAAILEQLASALLETPNISPFALSAIEQAAGVGRQATERARKAHLDAQAAG